MYSWFAPERIKTVSKPRVSGDSRPVGSSHAIDCQTPVDAGKRPCGAEFKAAGPLCPIDDVMPANEEEVLEVLANADATRLSTTEVAVALDISQPGAWRRLEKLAAAGLVTRTPDEDSPSDWWELSPEVREGIEEREEA